MGGKRIGKKPGLQVPPREFEKGMNYFPLLVEYG